MDRLISNLIFTSDLSTHNSLEFNKLPFDIYSSISRFLFLRDIIALTSVNKRLYSLRTDKRYLIYLALVRLTKHRERLPETVRIFKDILYLNNAQGRSAFLYAIKCGYEMIVYKTTKYNEDQFNNLDVSQLCEDIVCYMTIARLDSRIAHKYEDSNVNNVQEFINKDEIDKLTFIARPYNFRGIICMFYDFRIHKLCTKFVASGEERQIVKQEKSKLIQNRYFQCCILRGMYKYGDVEFLELINIKSRLPYDGFERDLLLSNNFKVLEYMVKNDLVRAKRVEYGFPIKEKIIKLLLDANLVDFNNNSDVYAFSGENLLLFKEAVKYKSREKYNKIKYCHYIYNKKILDYIFKVCDYDDIISIIEEFYKDNHRHAILYLLSLFKKYDQEKIRTIINLAFKYADIQVLNYLIIHKKVNKKLIDKTCPKFIKHAKSTEEIKYIIKLVYDDVFNVIVKDNLTFIPISRTIRMDNLDDLKYLINLFKLSRVTRKSCDYLQTIQEYAIEKYRRQIVNYLYHIYGPLCTHTNKPRRLKELYGKTELELNEELEKKAEERERCQESNREVKMEENNGGKLNTEENDDIDYQRKEYDSDYDIDATSYLYDYDDIDGIN